MMNDQLKKYIENNREEFDVKEPPAMMWQNIKTTIPNLNIENQDVEQDRIEPKKFIIKPIYYGVAASILVVLVTYFGFNFSSTKNSTIQNSMVKINSIEKNVDKDEVIEHPVFDQVETKVSNKIDAIEDQLITFHSTQQKIENLKSSVVESAIFLIQDTISTSNRIKGISLLENEKLSKENLLFLRDLSLNDANSVVRLNALELYSKNLKKEDISEELTSIFLQQNDAMVQLELIHLIKSLNNGFEDPNLIKKLQEIILDSKSSPFVKDEAYVVLLQKNKI